jgi:hypothetical protein
MLAVLFIMHGRQSLSTKIPHVAFSDIIILCSNYTIWYVSAYIKSRYSNQCVCSSGSGV